MPKTALLSPLVAIKLAWGLTGRFPEEEFSKNNAVLVEDMLKDIRERAKSHNDPKEKEYVEQSLALIIASFRNLETIYKGRNLNFDENERLRLKYMESIEENIDFGNKIKNILKSIPTMTITTAAGTITLVQWLSLSPIQGWGVGVACAALGYMINLGIVKTMRRQMQQNYVDQDYDRNLYYSRYVTQVTMTLKLLYLDIDRLHKSIFKTEYVPEASVDDLIQDSLKSIRPAFCDYIHKHKRMRIITPELWCLCETGHEEAVKHCKYWRK